MKLHSFRQGAGIAAFATLFACLVALLATAQRSEAKPPPIGDGSGDKVVLQQIGGGDFDQPVYTATAPGKDSKNLLFVVERTGAIRVVKGGTVLNKPFLDISDKLKTDFQGSDFNERGLLSVAFDPGYAKNRRFYVYYTSAPNGNIKVAQYLRKKDSAVLAKQHSATKIIAIPHGPFPNHNGGEVTFGPDGNMYLATGDGGFACDPNENAQNLDSLLGKLLRIIPKESGGYKVPSDNPFVGANGADEIYAYGLRNPFRFSFDKSSKAIAIADVGQDAWEEIDYLKTAQANGANFGWDAYEGDDPLVLSELCETGMFNGIPFTDGDTPTPPMPGTTFPILTYPHTSGDPNQYTGCAVIGGPVVKDEKLKSLYGRYLYSDSCNGGIQSMIAGTGGATDDKPLGTGTVSPSSIEEVSQHRIYITDFTGGVYRLKSGTPSPTSAADSEGGSRTGDGGGTFPGQTPW